ncbi:hypothetical protein GGI42DRAFT_326978 [Trichoderma sp. SZMC 28013]
MSSRPATGAQCLLLINWDNFGSRAALLILLLALLVSLECCVSASTTTIRLALEVCFVSGATGGAWICTEPSKHGSSTLTFSLRAPTQFCLLVSHCAFLAL